MTPEQALECAGDWLSAVDNEWGVDDRDRAALLVLGQLVDGASNQPRPLAVGDILDDERNGGFCGGMFGRDSYGDKTVEAIGPDWVVARHIGGPIVLAHCRPSELVEYRRPE